MKIDLSAVQKLIKKHGKEKGVLIPLLQDIQSVYGYVPKEAIDIVAKELSIYPVAIYGVLTFYSQFYLSARGRHIIRVCQGTACHVMGGKEIMDYLKGKLKIEEGDTTDDGMFTLERVACLGCCGMAPVIMIDDNFHGWCTVSGIEELLHDCLSQEV